MRCRFLAEFKKILFYPIRTTHFNISAYLGSATHMESYENKIPDEFMEKKPEMGGVSAVRINL